MPNCFHFAVFHFERLIFPHFLSVQILHNNTKILPARLQLLPQLQNLMLQLIIFFLLRLYLFGQLLHNLPALTVEL